MKSFYVRRIVTTRSDQKETFVHSDIFTAGIPHILP
jgi:hypothetical protein